MKKIIIGLVVLAALAGGIFLLSGKSKEASKNSEAKIEDKIYVAVPLSVSKTEMSSSGLTFHPILVARLDSAKRGRKSALCLIMSKSRQTTKASG